MVNQQKPYIEFHLEFKQGEMGGDIKKKSLPTPTIYVSRWPQVQRFKLLVLLIEWQSLQTYPDVTISVM